MPLYYADDSQNPEVKKISREDRITKHSRSGEWVDELDIFTCVEAFRDAVGDFDIEIHTFGTSYRSPLVKSDVTDERIKCIHLRYNGTHYDLLWPAGQVRIDLILPPTQCIV